jgi:archaellum biogenesis protein FlaJ (TadC family)
MLTSVLLSGVTVEAIAAALRRFASCFLFEFFFVLVVRQLSPSPPLVSQSRAKTKADLVLCGYSEADLADGEWRAGDGAHRL